MLSDRVQLSSAEARVEEIKGGTVGVFELSQGPALVQGLGFFLFVKYLTINVTINIL